jgi:uncharacterized Ntn-hydrolase superfamily protein
MTYSIVARDPTTSELGLAVQSRYFAVGRVVPWIEARVIPVPRAMPQPLVAGL